MLEKRYNSSNTYIDTYYIWDTEKKHFVGIIQDHPRYVTHQYFVAWKFENNRFIPNSHQLGKSKTCDTYEEALSYIQEPFE